ncbi:hypothetical protein SERLA73DRAFT_71505 [Serpula lacrymans var. lacrymans S7.3]|uniref:Uncharacterized protein n=2 Tax=Serpula lacrymans var. lacrymans TaxID=341189 RepID=F8PR88_SERL3|nr:uncharacterized protein SERLADRAFT_435880 [Serpula lacrymans var. lacrymans S7.9]EGO02379.1 hypothetical protein SERLA73DRAFT_71505 [Serpula lacrymans var. lacrymans S7.3]EGO28106.1 hypothetical protein SERLADRAFT_435880 [Serpula lacrymans var. lacrymans S7.9]
MFNASTTPCQWGSDAYTFSPSLTISDSCAINLIFSDIPFISIGILAFGISFFFILVKRFVLVAICIYFSVFFAFSASILDLGQLVAHGLKGVEPADIGATRPLLQGREVFLAISVGLRFLFYWIFVAEAPRGESQPNPVPNRSWTDFLVIEAKEGCHSGSWDRWGLTGHILKLVLFAASIAILVLQILWRIVSSFHYYGPIYAADTSLELVASILFILKLILNTSISPVTPRWRTLREYSVPIVALFLNAGIAIGNLICFAFTESTLGRFLQAIEYFILIVFILVVAFHRYESGIQRPAPPVQQNIMIPEKARESTFRITPPIVPTPTISMIFNSSSLNQARNASTEAIRRASRVSSWVSARISRQRSIKEDKVQLWSQKVAGDSPLPNQPADSLRRRDSIDSVLSEAYKESAKWDSMSYSTGLHPETPSAAQPVHSEADIPIIGERSAGSSRVLDSSSQSASSRKLLTTNLGIKIAPSYPSVLSQDLEGDLTVVMTAPADTQSQDSPIYGLDGISRSILRTTDTNQSVPGTRSTSVSLEELLRQQNDLDKSIAALRLFSPRSSTTGSTEDKSLSESPSPSGRDAPRHSASTGLRTNSTISLSHFPDPPWLTTPIPALPSPRPIPLLRAMEDRRSRLTLMSENSSTAVPYPPRMPAAQDDVYSSSQSQLLPESPCGEDEFTTTKAVRTPRFDSGGTQYDVTSFIGDLTSPGGQRKGSGIIDKESFAETDMGTGSIVNRPRPNPTSSLLKPPTFISQPRLPPNATSPLVPRRARLTGLPTSPANDRMKLSPLSKLSVIDTLPEEETENVRPHTPPVAVPSTSPAPMLTVSSSSGPDRSRTGRPLGLPPRPRLG